MKLTVNENLMIIQEKINQACLKAGRKKDEVKIIAVTKYTTVERVQEVLNSGIVNIGENRDEEFLHKYDVFKNQAIWHFIGTLQSRKVKNMIDKVDYVHSLDRLSLAKEINKRAGKVISCFVQVNIAEEESKHGLPKAETIDFIKNLEQLPNIRVIGLMTMAPNTTDESVLRKVFRQLRELRDEIQNYRLPFAPCTELSMGMSNDYEIAVEEGATFVRIGTALVGNS